MPLDTRTSSDNLSYNSAFRHPHIFRQRVLQQHDTIRSIHLGAPVRSAASGIKIPSLYFQPKSIGDKLFPIHTCQLSVFRTESPSLSSRQNLRPRRRKSPSFEHRLFFVFGPSFRIFQLKSRWVDYAKKQRWHLDEVGHHVQEMREKRKRTRPTLTPIG